ncbi:ribonuclease H [Candidatus Heimdallarchaeota archaeon B3_Heim]|nr:MAG: ribonuclease H [Candidatus Heimdallarchaeota archaeon B3_Heim]
MQDFSIFTDGAARGNPGPAAAAFLLVQNEKLLHKQNFFLGNRTNNQAEYQAIIKALEVAKGYTKDSIVLFSDSELVIKQLKGEYKVKSPHLRTLNHEVITQIKYFSSVKFIHAPRTNSWIKKADKLCNVLLNQLEK